MYKNLEAFNVECIHHNTSKIKTILHWFIHANDTKGFFSDFISRAVIKCILFSAVFRNDKKCKKNHFGCIRKEILNVDIDSFIRKNDRLANET